MMRTSVLFATALVLTACGGGGSEQTVDYSCLLYTSDAADE